MTFDLSHTAAIILAAGKGTRIGSHLPKVIYPLAGKPMISYIISTLKNVPIEKTFVVTGHRSEDVRATIGDQADFVHQDLQLGTGHALNCALSEIPVTVDTVLVVNGDDSAFYEATTLRKLLNSHIESKAVMSLLSVVIDNPHGFGRIVRDSQEKIKDIREEKEASEEERKIKEVNIGCYIFNVDWVTSCITRLAKSASGEFYIVDLVRLALQENKTVDVVNLPDPNQWHGVNTKEELVLADEAMQQHLIRQTQPTVFILDLDNTFLSTEELKKTVEERSRAILQPHMKEEKFREVFWSVYERQKQSEGWVSIPDFSLTISQEFKLPHLSSSIKHMFYTLPFKQYIVNQAEETFELLHSKGKVIIFGEGDLVYMPIKIRGTGLAHLIDDTYVYEIKKKHSQEIARRYHGYKQVIIDDQITILEEYKKVNQESITIWISEGPYSAQKPVNPTFSPDYAVSNFDEIEKIIRNWR